MAEVRCQRLGCRRWYIGCGFRSTHYFPLPKFSLLCLLFLANYAFSSGLSVQPGIGFLKDVPIGKPYKLDIPLSVHNKSTFDNIYVLSTFRLSKIGKEVLGYLDIPDPSWLYFERDEIGVKSGEVKEIGLYLNIPKLSMYYNQHWVVGIEIKGKAREKGAISLALYPYFIIETQSKNRVKRSYGEVDISPHQVIAEGVPLGMRSNIGEFKIYNNTRSACSYQIITSAGEIHLSPSYDWIPNPGWILPSKKEIRVASGESKVISLEVDIPKEKGYFNRHFEGTLWVKPSCGKPRFVRIQIITKCE